MRIDKVVVNASPLITLFRSGQAGLLPQLFQKIIVPDPLFGLRLPGVSGTILPRGS